MSYLVMESKAGYAVVLDNQGRFQKVPNLGYEVGETLDYVTIFPEETVVTPFRKKMASLVAAAACFLMLFIGSHQFLLTAYGTVRIQINPDVLLEINRLDYVIDLKGMNEDGVRLVEGYRYKGKRLESVSEELADLAMEEGYLKDGGEIVLTVESKHEKWRTDKETVLTEKISTHLEKRASVKVSAGGTDRTDGAGDGDWQHGSQNGQTAGTPVNGMGNGSMRNQGDRSAEDYDDDDRDDADDDWDDADDDRDDADDDRDDVDDDRGDADDDRDDADDDRDDADDDWGDADNDRDDADDDRDDADDDRDDADNDRDGADDDRDDADDDRDDADNDRDGADDDRDDADDDRDGVDDSRDDVDDGWKDADRSRKDADDDRDDADDHQNEGDGGRDDADDKHNGPGVARTIRAEQIDSGNGADHRNDADAGSSGEYNNHDREDSNHDDMDDDYDEEDNSDDSSDDHQDDDDSDDSDQDDDD